MSVEKFNPTITGEIIPYVQCNREVIQNIKNAEAGFVWIYLLSLPTDWNVVKVHIKNHFGFGQDKIKKIFAYLAKVNLIEYVQERGKDGKLQTQEIRVLNGSRFNKNGVCEQSYTAGGISTPPDVTAGGIYHPPVNHTCGKPTTTDKTDYKLDLDNKVENVSETKPHTYDPFKTEQSLKLCHDKKLDVDEELNKFVAWNKANNKKIYPELFISWLKNAKDLTQLSKNEPIKNEPRSTVKEYGPGHPTWESQKKWDDEQAKKRIANDSNEFDKCAD